MTIARSEAAFRERLEKEQRHAMRSHPPSRPEMASSYRARNTTDRGPVLFSCEVERHCWPPISCAHQWVVRRNGTHLKNQREWTYLIAHPAERQHVSCFVPLRFPSWLRLPLRLGRLSRTPVAWPNSQDSIDLGHPGCPRCNHDALFDVYFSKRGIGRKTSRHADKEVPP